TTTSLLVDALLRRGGRRTGVIGTIQYRIGEEARPAGQTTPEAVELQSLLAEMVTRGLGAVAMDVSSHALALLRAAGVVVAVEVQSPLVGEHNVMNLLGAVAVGLTLDMERHEVTHALASVSSVPGRFERVEAGQPFLVAVDYAHTPDALERVLTTARRLVAP